MAKSESTVKINTVLGPISPDDMGVTLPHEHICSGYPGWNLDEFSPALDFKTIADNAVAKIEKAKAYGLKTMVDPASMDFATDPALHRISPAGPVST